MGNLSVGFSLFYLFPGRVLSGSQKQSELSGTYQVERCLVPLVSLANLTRLLVWSRYGSV